MISTVKLGRLMFALTVLKRQQKRSIEHLIGLLLMYLTYFGPQFPTHVFLWDTKYPMSFSVLQTRRVQIYMVIGSEVQA